MLTLINPVERAEPFDHADGVFEAKFDGFRAAADTVRGRLISRNGKRMQHFERVLDLLPKGHVFDGELVLLDDAGRPVFNELLLAYARSAGNPTPIEVVVYPGAYHAWTVPGLATLRFYREYASTKKCPLILL
jgi:ATP-dependent DNA ligase